MNLRFIEAFVWVARLRSFKAAAEKLHTTQTAISARIATLENQFGVKLFERDKRTVVLTHSGEELLKYAEQLLGISARMMEAVADRSSYGGTVSIGAIEIVVHTWLPGLLQLFRQSFPKASVEIHSYMTADLHDELLKGNIDVAFTAQPIAEAAVENWPVCEFEMGWVAAPDLKLQKGALNANALDGLPILTFLRDSLVYRDVVEKLGGTARINPISSIAAMVSLIKSGYGIATLPYAAISREVEAGGLTWHDIEPRLAPVPIIASLRSQSDSPLAETLIPRAKEAAETFLSGLHAEAVSRRA